MKLIVTSSTGCAVGPGQRFKLSKAQIATREHALTVLDDKTGEVEPTTQIVFKAGEVINLPGKYEDLSSYFRSVLEPHSAAKADDKPKSAAAVAASQPGTVNPDAGGAQSGSGNGAPNPAA